MLKINSAIEISSFDDASVSVSIIFNEGASNSKIYGINFVNASITLINASNIQISENTFSNSTLTFCAAEKSIFKNNDVSDESKIIINNAKSIQILNNTFNVTSSNLKVFSILNAQNTLIKDNVINASSNSLVVIYSNNF